MNLTCQRCKSKMTLLFTSAVCDVCNPPGFKVRPVVDISPFLESQGFDPSKFEFTVGSMFVERDLVVVLDTTVKDHIKVTINKVRGVQGSKLSALPWIKIDHIIWGELIWRAYSGSVLDENLQVLPNTTRLFSGKGYPKP